MGESSVKKKTTTDFTDGTDSQGPNVRGYLLSFAFNRERFAGVPELRSPGGVDVRITRPECFSSVDFNGWAEIRRAVILWPFQTTRTRLTRPLRSRAKVISRSAATAPGSGAKVSLPTGKNSVVFRPTRPLAEPKRCSPHSSLTCETPSMGPIRISPNRSVLRYCPTHWSKNEGSTLTGSGKGGTWAEILVASTAPCRRWEVRTILGGRELAESRKLICIPANSLQKTESDCG